MISDDRIDAQLRLSFEDAEKLAKEYQSNDTNEAKDPFPEIAPALLAAEHIEKYIMKTGMIGPYYASDGSKSRLKKAAYEGRVGCNAYQFDAKGKLRTIFNSKTDDVLAIGANSIIFVEPDFTFFLPNFIAARFNLCIRHVHRGLLLGTGPLVDPGYRGKLCIPLHNLTDEEHVIAKGDGLIWIEFTKTTWGLEPSDKTMGRAPLATVDPSEFSDITRFIQRSAKRQNHGDWIPIRSSIPMVFSGAKESAEQAEKSSKEALESAKQAERSASAAQNWVIGARVC